MEQNNLVVMPESSSEPKVSESFREAFVEYKENFSFFGFVYLPIATMAVLGIFVPGVVGGSLALVAGILGVLATFGFISAVSKKFYPETVLPLDKLKVLYRDGIKYAVPILWIGILTSLCVFFGLALFVIPGIWLSVILGYSTYVLIFEGKRGTEALAHSYIYAKDNFWFIVKRLITLSIGIAIVGAIISAIFPPEKKLLKDLTGDEYSSLSVDLKDNEYVKKFFKGEEPYIAVRQQGDEALSAIFSNIFAIPFTMFIYIGIFNFLRKKNCNLATEEEVKKIKKKIKIFVWLGILLPIIIIGGGAIIFGGAAISSLQQLLP